jgi:protein-tyrosine phosphatase
VWIFEAIKLTAYAIHSLPVAGGSLAIAPMPGRHGAYTADLSQISDWSPTLVISMVETEEFASKGAASFGDDLLTSGIQWRHVPVPDYGVPATLNWFDLCNDVLVRLRSGESVLIHCMGGCGRSGMIALRLMIAAGEPADAALLRLRKTRPCAIETMAQMTWAMQDVGST